MPAMGGKRPLTCGAHVHHTCAMPYQPRPPTIAALGLASFAATGLTTVAAAIAAAVEDVGQMLSRGVSVGGFLSGVLADLVFAPFLGIVFGFAGAFMFLGGGFLLVRKSRRRLTYACAGALAGLCHSLCALAARSTGQLEDAPFLVTWLSGFLLIEMGRSIVVWVAFPASMAAGAVAGLIYARIVGVPRAEATT